MSSAIVPAAGQGARFGSNKWLAEIDGEPMLERTLRCLLDGGVGEVVVVLSPAHGDVSRLVSSLADSRVRTIINPDPSRGMFSSIQVGMAIARGDPILLLPADMPFVRSTTVTAVLAACGRTKAIVLPSYRGRHGHPIALPIALGHAILRADPLTTLDVVLKAAQLSRVDLDVDDAGVLRDVDTRSDLDAPS